MKYFIIYYIIILPHIDVKANTSNIIVNYRTKIKDIVATFCLYPLLIYRMYIMVQTITLVKQSI